MSLVQPLIWPDAEADFVAYLTGQLGPGVPVSTQVQDPRPASFVLVERAGGPRLPDSIFETARMACQFWGPTKAAASALALTCRDLLYQMPAASPLPSGFTVYRVQEFLGPTWAPDDVESPSTPRYLLTVEARYRALPKGT